MTENDKLVESMSDYDKLVLAEGLAIILKRHVGTKNLGHELNTMSQMYGGTGLVSVMDYLRNNSN